MPSIGHAFHSHKEDVSCQELGCEITSDGEARNGSLEAFEFMLSGIAAEDEAGLHSPLPCTVQD